MYNILYAELNFVCLLIVGGHIYQVLRGHDNSRRMRTFLYVMISIAIICAADSVFGLAQYYGAPLWVGRSLNYIYHLGINAASYFWLVYLERRQNNEFVNEKIGLWVLAIPMIISDIMLATGKIFTIDETGYHRGDLAYVQAFLCFAPILFSAAKVLIRSFNKKYYYNKSEYRMLAVIALSMIALSALQVMINEIDSTICVGATVAVIFVYESYQAKLISSDPLTELNNRNSLDKFLMQKIGAGEKGLYLILIDIDDFKALNDTYGHVEGDRALLMLSGVLRRSVPPKFIITRYGGDEFVISGCAESEDEIKAAVENIQSVLHWTNETNGEKWNVEISVGYSEYGKEIGSIPELVSAADAKMYKEKSRVHA